MQKSYFLKIELRGTDFTSLLRHIYWENMRWTAVYPRSADAYTIIEECYNTSKYDTSTLAIVYTTDRS